MSIENVIRLRAHHLLCLQGFQGYGYTKDFVRHLYDILDRFDSEPELVIEVISECDDICVMCPHNTDEVCVKKPDAAEKIKDMDKRVLRKIALEDGGRGTADELIERINDVFKDINDVQPVCGECDWKKDCLWYLARVHEL